MKRYMNMLPTYIRM